MKLSDCVEISNRLGFLINGVHNVKVTALAEVNAAGSLGIEQRRKHCLSVSDGLAAIIGIYTRATQLAGTIFVKLSSGSGSFDDIRSLLLELDCLIDDMWNVAHYHRRVREIEGKA